MDPSLAGGDFKTLPSMKSKSFVFIQMVLPCYTWERSALWIEKSVGQWRGPPRNLGINNIHFSFICSMIVLTCRFCYIIMYFIILKGQNLDSPTSMRMELSSEADLFFHFMHVVDEHAFRYIQETQKLMVEFSGSWDLNSILLCENDIKLFRSHCFDIILE